jgi:uncharacterized SAM-binding protein YcdF (DUF218 family)
MLSRRRIVAGLIVIAAAVVIGAASAEMWLPYVGLYLKKSGPPKKADIALVLAGDYYGKRLLEGAQLVKDGYVPRVLVSGPAGHYGFHECDLAIPYGVKQGFPESFFVHGENEAHSTREEAHEMTAQLRKLGVKSFILVTSDYHTRRAGWMLRKEAPEMQVYVVAAPDADWELRTWWQNREGQKAVVTEWLKSLTAPFGI